ncbi:MAG: lipid-binding SYLF domain-containing protein [Verrucomicrobia bacterium]|nr:lipid-binding SYLF domain-containing protein [Verrucomicrobiota bacterium]
MKAAIIGLTLLGMATSVLAIDKATLDNRLRRLGIKFAEMQEKPDRHIPDEMLGKAEGIILLDRTKAGFLFGFQGGSGVALVKDPRSGQWSPAAFLGATEASLGFQVGAQQSFIVILLMTTNATRRLNEATFEFGGEARGTAGNSSGGVDATVTSQEQAMLVYEDRKGLYGGVALKAGLLAADPQANLAYYGEAVTLQDIVFDRKMPSTEAASELAQRIFGAKPAGIAAGTPASTSPVGQKVKATEAAAAPAAKTNEAKTADALPNVQTSAAHNDLAGEQLRLLLADLKASKQTNALNHLNGYLTAMLASVYTADAQTTLLILERLRAGHTTEATTLLETRLDGALINLGASVGTSPQPERQPDSLQTLRRAKEYRTRFPRKTGNSNVDDEVARALSLLDKQK